jgi:hypothetical protein
LGTIIKNTGALEQGLRKSKHLISNPPSRDGSFPNFLPTAK